VWRNDAKKDFTGVAVIQVRAMPCAKAGCYVLPKRQRRGANFELPGSAAFTALSRLARFEAGAYAVPKKPIIPRDSPPPLAPYSPGIRAGDVVYVSGVLAMDKDGKTVGEGDAAKQTRQVLENIKGVLEAAGCTMRDVVFNAIFLKDMSDYGSMNNVYREYFPVEPPARYCIRADLVKPEFLVEIASTAHVPE
jgi:aminoacrylate peracid reductase